MAWIFISYSRVDTAFVEKLYHRIQQMRPSCTVWYDQAPHGVLGGDVWWDEIMNAVSAADIFIYVLSNESVRSRYCQAEFAEARRLQKRIITIQARDRTKLTGELRDIQYVDMKNGVDDPEALARLGGALDRQLSLVKKQRPLWYPRTPRPEDEETPVRHAAAPEVDTPTLRNPVPPVPDRPPKRPARGLWVLGAVIAALMIGAVMIALSGLLSGGDDDPNDGKETPQTQAVGVERSETPEPTLDIALIVQTLDAQATLDGATLNAQATVAARATNYAGGTQSAQNQTATATLWTFTPTPNITASIEAYRTQQAGDQTATATLWTATFTPTETLTPTLTATVTPAPTHTPTATPEPLEAALMRARNFSGGNADWEPLVQTFDGVEMVLVPAGCFEMGSTQYDDEKPPHRVCFDEPYWMDRTEVTNGQFATLNGQAVKSSYFSGDERPREQITWTEASAFCESRGARLPTEAEWEYAARGPEAWEYPWGDGFDGSKVVWNRSESDGTAPVGSLPAGASWVGALDMSGNVWEWVADWYGESYYASLENGVSNPTGPTSGEYRVLRGGSWWYNITYNLRAASRNWASPGYWNINIGFRCARSAAG